MPTMALRQARSACASSPPDCEPAAFAGAGFAGALALTCQLFPMTRLTIWKDSRAWRERYPSKVRLASDERLGFPQSRFKLLIRNRILRHAEIVVGPELALRQEIVVSAQRLRRGKPDLATGGGHGAAWGVELGHLPARPVGGRPHRHSADGVAERVAAHVGKHHALEMRGSLLPAVHGFTPPGDGTHRCRHCRRRAPRPRPCR